MGDLICRAKYELHAIDALTHTCDLEQDHEGPHHCPRCGTNWGGRS